VLALAYAAAGFGVSRNERSRGRRDDAGSGRLKKGTSKARRRTVATEPRAAPLIPTAPTRTHESSGAPRQRRRRFRERRRRRGRRPLIPTAPPRRRVKHTDPDGTTEEAGEAAESSAPRLQAAAQAVRRRLRHWILRLGQSRPGPMNHERGKSGVHTHELEAPRGRWARGAWVLG